MIGLLILKDKIKIFRDIFKNNPIQGDYIPSKYIYPKYTTYVIQPVLFKQLDSVSDVVHKGKTGPTNIEGNKFYYD